jgi:hypothetical protein
MLGRAALIAVPIVLVVFDAPTAIIVCASVIVAGIVIALRRPLSGQRRGRS